MIKQIVIISALASAVFAYGYGGTKTTYLASQKASAAAPFFTESAAPVVARTTSLLTASGPLLNAAPVHAAQARVFTASAPLLKIHAAPAFAAAAPAFTAAAAAPAFASSAFLTGGPAGTFTTGPAVVDAAIQSRHQVQYVDVPSSRQITPISIDIGADVIPVNMVFRSASTRLTVEQNHFNQEGSVQETASEDEPHVLRHTVNKPILQEVLEVISPFRRITQQVNPVQEEITTLVARGQPTSSSTVVASTQTAAAAPAVVTGPVLAPAPALVTAPAVATAPAVVTGPALAPAPALVTRPALAPVSTLVTGPAVATAPAVVTGHAVATPVTSHLVSRPAEATRVTSTLVSRPAEATRVTSHHLVSRPAEATRITSHQVSRLAEAAPVTSTLVSRPAEATRITSHLVSRPAEATPVTSTLVSRPTLDSKPIDSEDRSALAPFLREHSSNSNTGGLTGSAPLSPAHALLMNSMRRKASAASAPVLLGTKHRK